MKKLRPRHKRGVLLGSRIPVPQKPPKFEIPKKRYSRRRQKKDLARLLTERKKDSR